MRKILKRTEDAELPSKEVFMPGEGKVFFILPEKSIDVFVNH
jgi:hypothetical protein